MYIRFSCFQASSSVLVYMDKLTPPPSAGRDRESSDKEPAAANGTVVEPEGEGRDEKPDMVVVGPDGKLIFFRGGEPSEKN
jgi:hypothetical protein